MYGTGRQKHVKKLRTQSLLLILGFLAKVPGNFTAKTFNPFYWCLKIKCFFKLGGVVDIIRKPFFWVRKEVDLKIKSESYYIKRVGDTCFVVETQGQP